MRGITTESMPKATFLFLQMLNKQKILMIDLIVKNHDGFKIGTYIIRNGTILISIQIKLTFCTLYFISSNKFSD